MNMLQLLRALDSRLDPTECKVHLACYNGKEDPLDVYFEGRFDEWQESQNKRNFQRPYVIAMIALRERNNWLFAGLHRVHSISKRDSKKHSSDKVWYRYATSREERFDTLGGRVTAAYKRPRQTYLYAENCLDQMQVVSITPEKIQFVEFPGYLRTQLTKQQLDTVVRMQVPSWRSALSSVSAVYVISDGATGKLYIGSAYGTGGLWGRWSAYAVSGHGGNCELKQLLSEKGADYAEHFVYGILETFDERVSELTIIERESYWKSLLFTRTYGYNSN